MPQFPRDCMAEHNSYVYSDDMLSQCAVFDHFCWQNCQKKCISMNDMSPPMSDHAGWWIQGAESPGCQKTHPEDDGWEGKTFFFPLLKYLINHYMQDVYCMFSFFVFFLMLALFRSITGWGHDLHGARKTGYVTFRWWVCGGPVRPVVSAM